MDDYLTKPIRREDLAAALERWATHAGSLEPPAAPAVEARGTTAAGGFSLAEALARASGDAELLVELAGILLEDAPRQLDALMRAHEEADRASIKSVAHALRGAVANLGASDMVAALRDVEAVVRAGTVDECAEPLDRAVRAWTRLESALRAWVEAR